MFRMWPRPNAFILALESFQLREKINELISLDKNEFLSLFAFFIAAESSGIRGVSNLQRLAQADKLIVAPMHVYETIKPLCRVSFRTTVSFNRLI